MIPVRLPRTVLVLAALTLGPAAAAQVNLALTVGATGGTALVRDAIVAPIEVRQATGPLVGLHAALPLAASWGVRAALRATWTMLRGDAAAAAPDLGAARTLAAELGLTRRLGPGAAAALAVGVIGYQADARGVFRAGGPGLTPLAALTLRYAPPVPALDRVSLEARYDVHRFLTPALRDVGFTSGRAVHRAALALSIRLAGRPW